MLAATLPFSSFPSPTSRPPSTEHPLLRNYASPDLKEAVDELPSRLLFENEFVRIVLVGLSRETDRIQFQPCRPVLVMVTFGRLLARGEGVVRELAEGSQLRLKPCVQYRLCPVEAADLVFFEPLQSGDPQVGASGQ